MPEEPVVPSGGFAAAIDPEARESNGLFRKAFTLDRVPDRVPARITADSRYVLYVNGRELGRGPIRSQFRRLQYDMYDLAPYLVVGRERHRRARQVLRPGNGLLDAGHPQPHPGPTRRPGLRVRPGSRGLAGQRRNAGRRAVPTPGTILSVDGRELAAAGVPLGDLRCPALPHDWKSAAFDDAPGGRLRSSTRC